MSLFSPSAVQQGLSPDEIKAAKVEAQGQASYLSQMDAYYAGLAQEDTHFNASLDLSKSELVMKMLATYEEQEWGKAQYIGSSYERGSQSSLDEQIMNLIREYGLEDDPAFQGILAEGDEVSSLHGTFGGDFQGTSQLQQQSLDIQKLGLSQEWDMFMKQFELAQEQFDWQKDFSEEQFDWQQQMDWSELYPFGYTYYDWKGDPVTFNNFSDWEKWNNRNN